MRIRIRKRSGEWACQFVGVFPVSLPCACNEALHEREGGERLRGEENNTRKLSGLEFKFRFNATSPVSARVTSSDGRPIWTFFMRTLPPLISTFTVPSETEMEGILNAMIICSSNCTFFSRKSMAPLNVARSEGDPVTRLFPVIVPEPLIPANANNPNRDKSTSFRSRSASMKSRFARRSRRISDFPCLKTALAPALPVNRRGALAAPRAHPVRFGFGRGVPMSGDRVGILSL